MQHDFKIIESHSAQAPFYKYRTPYLATMFDGIVRDLGLNDQSVLADACCGRGELSSRLIDRVGRIHAFDGSQEMLDHALRHDRISYSLCDVNADRFKAPEPINHILIGRALHWIERDNLRQLIDDNLADDGTVLICSSFWMSDGPWEVPYKKLLDRFCRHEKPPRQHFTGTDKLESVGLKLRKTVMSKALMRVSFRYLFAHTLSGAYGEDFNRLMTHRKEFAEALVRSLQPFLVDGKLQKKITSYAAIYERA